MGARRGSGRSTSRTITRNERRRGTSAVGEGPGWHWVTYVDPEGWQIGGNEPCDCPVGTGHVVTVGA